MRRSPSPPWGFADSRAKRNPPVGKPFKSRPNLEWPGTDRHGRKIVAENRDAAKNVCRRSRCNLIETPLGEAPDISPQAVNFRDRRCYNPIILEKRVAPAVPLQISQAAPMILAWIIVEGIVITVGIVAVAVRIGIGMIMLLR